MKIKTSSWHYALIVNFGDEIPRNLCGYLWALLKSTTGFLFLMAIVTLVGYLLLLPILYLIAGFQYGFFYMDDPAMLCIVIGACLWVIVSLVVLMHLGVFDYIERKLCISIDYSDE
jgi:hypothetical protein